MEHPANMQGHGHPGGMPQGNGIMPPFLVSYSVTRECNLRCKHCYSESSDNVPKDELTTEQAFRLLDEVVSWGPKLLIFDGGEPLKRADFFDLAKHASSKGIRTVIGTNATLIDRGVAQKLKDCGVMAAQISVDGANAKTHDAFRGLHGSFDDALRGIRSLRKAGVDVQINVTFTKANRDEASDMLDLVQMLDACALHVFLLVPVGCGVELPDDVRLDAAEVERLLTFFDEQASERDLEVRATCAPQSQRIRQQRARARQRKGLPEARGLAPSSKGCLAGGGILFIDAVGKVFPCGYLPMQAGDLRTTPLKTILETSELLSSLRDVTKLEGRCHGCEYDQICGGCRARALGTTGRLFDEEPSCPMNMIR